MPIAWVKEQLEGILSDAETARSHANGSKLEIVSLSTCTGEATQWLVRGKKRGGFELTAEFAVEGVDPSGNPASATLALKEISGDDLDDLEPTLTWKELAGTDADQRAIREAAKGLTEMLAEALGELLERIKAR